MADAIDTQLRVIAERHAVAVADDAVEYAEMLMRDADALLDAKLAASLDA